MTNPRLQGFISYRRNQASFAKALADQFAKALAGHGHLDGMTLFRDVDSQTMSQNWRDQLARGIATSCMLVVIGTEDWFLSATCREEYRLFRQSVGDMIRHFAPEMSEEQTSQAIDKVTIAFMPNTINKDFQQRREKDNDESALAILATLEDQQRALPSEWKGLGVESTVEDFALKHAADVALQIAETYQTITGADDFTDAMAMVSKYLAKNADRVRARAKGVLARIEHIDAGITEIPRLGTAQWVKYQRERVMTEDEVKAKVGALADLEFMAVPLESETLILTRDSITGDAIGAHKEIGLALAPGTMTYDFSEAFQRAEVRAIMAGVCDDRLALPKVMQAEELLKVLGAAGAVREMAPLHAPRTLWAIDEAGEPLICGATLEIEAAPIYLRWTGDE